MSIRPVWAAVSLCSIRSWCWSSRGHGGRSRAGATTRTRTSRAISTMQLPARKPCRRRSAANCANSVCCRPSTRRHGDVIDQPGAAERGSDQEPERAFTRQLYLTERFGVAEFEIIEREAGVLDRAATFVEHAGDLLA